MTEYDSGSSSDSSAESGSSSAESWSSSDASSGGGGLDYSFIAETMIGGLVDDLTEPRRQDSRPVPAPSEVELRRRAQFEATLRAIISAPSPVADQRSLVRRIVEAERWFVPIEPDGSFVRLRTIDDRTLQAFTLPLSADGAGSRRARPKLAPSSVVTAHVSDPGCAARQLTGRELARAIPADAGGILLVLNDETTFGLGRAELPLLTQLADSLDLEQLLIDPAPGQIAALRAARWYVPASNEKLRPKEPGYGDPTVLVYTHPDRAEARTGPMIELDGLTLCTQLAGRGDYVGIDVNVGRPVGSGDQETRALVLGPSFARDVVRGVDRRPGGAPLPARTLAEVILWLDLEGFPWEDREIVAVAHPDASPGASVAPSTPVSAGAVLIQVRAKGPSVWRIYETSYTQERRRGPILSPVFALARPEPLPANLPAPVPPAFVTVYGGHLNPDAAALSTASIDLGEGQTQILCAGKLARWLSRDHTWKSPGWLVKKGDRLRAARMAGWAYELLKLIPPGADRLPRSSLRTVDGAALFHQRPEFRDRAWIEKHHQRYTRAATRRFNF